MIILGKTSTAKHLCPRRSEGFGRLADPGVTGPDSYGPKHGLVGQPSGCTYCGSMSGDDFMDLVRAGAEIGPTDKSYKLYVKGIPRDGDPDEPRVVSTSSSPGDRLRGWKDLTRAEKRAVKNSVSWPENYKEGYYSFMPWGPTVDGKFYTKHLSDEQGWEFDRLWRDGKINWGYPGYPYVKLYIPGPSTATRDSAQEGEQP